MKETILNKYVKVEPIEHQTFIYSQKESYEEIGVVLAKDESITDIPVGSKVYFDSFMAKKYPVLGEEGKFQWFVHYAEIVKVEHADESVSK